MKETKKTEKLTPREEEVFELILKGYNNREIGNKLKITYLTSKLMSNRVLKKMKVHSKQKLIAKYLK